MVEINPTQKLPITIKSYTGHWLCPRQGVTRFTFEEREVIFWKLVKHDNKTGCWLWLGRKDKNGYGHFSFNGGDILAHRFAWLSTYGKLPSKPFLCHDCDTPFCVNPKHLFPGTHSDNVQDKVKKQRHAHGTKHPFAKFNCVQLENIIKSPLTDGEVAAECGVSANTIWRIRNGKRYKLETKQWLL